MLLGASRSRVNAMQSIKNPTDPSIPPTCTTLAITFPPRDDCQTLGAVLLTNSCDCLTSRKSSRRTDPAFQGYRSFPHCQKVTFKGGNNPPVAVWRFPRCCQHLVARRPAGRQGYKGRTERRTLCWRVAEYEIDRVLSIELEARAQKKEDVMVLLVCRGLRCEKDRDFAGRCREGRSGCWNAEGWQSGRLVRWSGGCKTFGFAEEGAGTRSEDSRAV